MSIIQPIGADSSQSAIEAAETKLPTESAASSSHFGAAEESVLQQQCHQERRARYKQRRLIARPYQYHLSARRRINLIAG